MKKNILPFLVASILYSCGSTKSIVSSTSTPIIASIDLVDVVDDKVQVHLNPGRFTTSEVVFNIPKTVPGTYSEDNYGKYIEDFKALDYKGKELPVLRRGDNSWVISGGQQLDEVVYWVNDTFDTESEQDEPVFSPSGTNILVNSNFMLNLHGFVGYFDGLKEVAYELVIDVPNGLNSTTSMPRKAVDAQPGKEVFTASRYFEVIDNPILYAAGDNATFEINGITVSLSVHSPNKVYSALSLKNRMEQMMSAQKAFLGTMNTTKEYTILLYLSTLDSVDASGFGALEHHTSTVVVLPESMQKERLEEAMVDVVSHEFFHIVTPLNVHSEEVQYFDFNNPKMSQHLWLYEGTTEYFANLFQVQQGLINEAAFYERIMGKISNSMSYDDEMSFTEMSSMVLSAPYKDNYGNVYEKGALINMALDILLREKSNGKRSVLWLMTQLSKKYGKDISFKDENLFTEIVALTYPEVDAFFNTHVIGTTPISYAMYFAKVGLEVKEKSVETGYFLNGQMPFIDVTDSDEIVVRNGISLNTFFTRLGLQGGDIIAAIDGQKMTLDAIRPLIGQSFGWSPDKEISIDVVRNDEKINFKGKVGTPTVMVEELQINPEATSNQIALKNAWLKQ